MRRATPVFPARAIATGRTGRRDRARRGPLVLAWIVATSSSAGSFARPAHADPDRPESRVEAAYLFQRGQAAADAGRWDEACESFDESLHLEDATGTMLNLADCEEHRNHLARAWQLYEDAGARLPPSDPRKPFATKRAAALLPRIPRLTIRLAETAPKATEITRDGLALSARRLGVALPVETGSHAVVATFQGASSRTTVTLAEGEAREIVVGADLARAPAGAAAPPSAAAASTAGPRNGPRDEGRGLGDASARETRETNDGARATWRTVGYGLAGLGIVGVGAGAIFGGMALSEASTVKSHCDDGLRCDDEGLRAGDRAGTFGNVSTVAFVVAAVAAVATVAVFLGPGSHAHGR